MTLKKEGIIKYIKTPNIDFSLFECVTSTNDLLKSEALNGAKEGKVIAALKQTNGRGRQGKSFISNRGGIYLSILIKPKDIDFDTTLITSATAVAVCRAIEDITKQNTAIKWVNDVLINGKKVCGILCESGICKDNNFIVVGIGLNLYCEAFADEIRDVAGCVFKTPKTQEFEALTAKIIDNFFEIYNTNDFLEYYKNKCFVLGKEISVIKNGREIKAFALDIDNKCRLKVKYNNREELLSTGEISIKLKEL